jgi:hypothetical protein
MSLWIKFKFVMQSLLGVSIRRIMASTLQSTFKGLQGNELLNPTRFRYKVIPGSQFRFLGAFFDQDLSSDHLFVHCELGELLDPSM